MFVALTEVTVGFKAAVKELLFSDLGELIIMSGGLGRERGRWPAVQGRRVAVPPLRRPPHLGQCIAPAGGDMSGGRATPVAIFTRAFQGRRVIAPAILPTPFSQTPRNNYCISGSANTRTARAGESDRNK